MVSANLVDIRCLIRTSTPQVFYAWRRFALRLFGARIGKDVLIRPGVRVTYPWKLVVGDNCWIGDGVRLYNIDEITLGDHTVVSQDAYLCSGTMTPETSPSR
jgi:putative colanic acid biosynthesis acetyltransferase WcaF